MANEITIYKRDTPTFTVTVKDDDGVVFDLTNYTARFTAKKVSTDTDDNAEIGPVTGTISTPSTGIITFTLSRTDTDVDVRSYDYDVQIDNSVTSKTFTVVSSKIIVLQDITVTVTA